MKDFYSDDAAREAASRLKNAQDAAEIAWREWAIPEIRAQAKSIVEAVHNYPEAVTEHLVAQMLIETLTKCDYARKAFSLDEVPVNYTDVSLGDRG